MATSFPNARPVEIGNRHLQGLLRVPEKAVGLVIFAHGSGSGRLSPRNNYVAEGLHKEGLATLLLDLLTPAEEGNRAVVFDIPLLASRLAMAKRWAGDAQEVAKLPVGYFGASTGAGAALVAAGVANGTIGAVVSRGGRPDLAGEMLSRVRAPTMLIVGSLDGPVIGLNRNAFDQLIVEKELVIVPGAGHLFEEPGTLDEVIRHAVRWFLTHLPPLRGGGDEDLWC